MPVGVVGSRVVGTIRGWVVLSSSQNAYPKAQRFSSQHRHYHLTFYDAPFRSIRQLQPVRMHIRTMAPSNGMIYILRCKGASYYPSIIILLRLRKVIANLSGIPPTLSWILYTFAILFKLAQVSESLIALNASKRGRNHK